MQDYSRAEGPLRLTFNPPDKITAAAITAAAGADDVIKALGLKIDYAGTRKQEVAAPAPAPATPNAAAAAPKKGGKETTKDEDDDDDSKDARRNSGIASAGRDAVSL